MTNIFNKQHSRELRRQLRQSSTVAEELLWQAIRSGQLGPRFKRQFGIGKYIVDFYAPRVRLVIELDGSIHAIEGAKENDHDRQLNLETLGLTVVRFTNEEILGNLDKVLQRIQDFLLQNPLLTKERVG